MSKLRDLAKKWLADEAVSVSVRMFVDEEVENEGAFQVGSWMLGNELFFAVVAIDANKINEASEDEQFYVVPDIQPSGFAAGAVGAGVVKGKAAGVNCSAVWARPPGMNLWGVQLVFHGEGVLFTVGKRSPWTWHNATSMRGQITLPPRITG